MLSVDDLSQLLAADKLFKNPHPHLVQGLKVGYIRNCGSSFQRVYANLGESFGDVELDPIPGQQSVSEFPKSVRWAAENRNQTRSRGEGVVSGNSKLSPSGNSNFSPPAALERHGENWKDFQDFGPDHQAQKNSFSTGFLFASVLLREDGAPPLQCLQLWGALQSDRLSSRRQRRSALRFARRGIGR